MVPSISNREPGIYKKCILEDFWSRWRHRQTWLTSSHHHIKIANHSEPSEIELNGSLTTTELKKPHPSRLVGGVQTENGLVSHPRVVDKSLGGISQDQGVLPHTRTPSPGFQGQEDKSPQLLAAKTSGVLSSWKKLQEP